MPIAAPRSEARMKLLTVRFAFAIAVELWTGLVLASCGTVLRAQTIAIKVVNGHNGRPIADKCMYVWVGNRSDPGSKPLLETQTDANGVISLRLTHEDVTTNGGGQRLACGLTGLINPVAKLGDTISIHSGYALCQPGTRDYTWLARANFSTDEVLRHGFVSENTCGKASASPKPGEIVLFVRPLTWWERLKQ